jgi:crotonobetainyl-CoA:carnitine CoA-transferase CaiB-like acyl-CoA transferase
LSQLETLLSIAGDMLLATSVTGEDPKRHGNRSEDCWPQGVYRCAGPDNWVAVTVQSDAERQSLFALLAGDSIADLGDAETELRRADSTRIDRAISNWAGELDAEQAARRLQAAGVPACPAFTSAELFANPQLRDRGFFVSWDQPDVGVSVFPGFPIHFKYGETRITSSPTLGGHNGEVLQEFIGCSDDEVTELFEAGVIADKPNW